MLAAYRLNRERGRISDVDRADVEQQFAPSVEALRLRHQQRPLVIGQVEHPGLGIGGADDLVEDPDQQQVEVRLAGDHRADVEELADRLLHASDRIGELVDLDDAARRQIRVGEVEAPDRADVLGQAYQRLGDAPRHQHRDADAEQQDHRDEQRRLARRGIRLGKQHVVGDCHQHAIGLSTTDRDLNHQATVIGAVDAEPGHLLAPAGGVLGQAAQHAVFRHLQRGDAQLARVVGVGTGDAFGVRMRDQPTVGVDQRDVAVSGRRQARQPVAHRRQRDIDTGHGLAAVAACQRGPHLAGGEEDVRPGLDLASAAVGTAEPGPLARIVDGIVERIAAFDLAPACIVESEQAARRPVGIAVDRLHQVTCPLRRCETLARRLIVDTPYEHEVAVRVADEHARQRRVVVEVVAEPPAVTEAVLERWRVHHRTTADQLDGELGRPEDVTDLGRDRLVGDRKALGNRRLLLAGVLAVLGDAEGQTHAEHQADEHHHQLHRDAPAADALHGRAPGPMPRCGLNAPGPCNCRCAYRTPRSDAARSSRRSDRDCPAGSPTRDRPGSPRHCATAA